MVVFFHHFQFALWTNILKINFYLLIYMYNFDIKWEAIKKSKASPSKKKLFFLFLFFIITTFRFYFIFLSFLFLITLWYNMATIMLILVSELECIGHFTTSGDDFSPEYVRFFFSFFLSFAPLFSSYIVFFLSRDSWWTFCFFLCAQI
jgi:hypothetical protein